ncbi:MAG TPA: tyrosine-type recombinase/integrase [Chitinophagaceae bacterium]|nr:tyrosine-type recombinase/integrase [Chitinophagaceae bacterium]
MKPLITLKPFLHRGGEHLGIYFDHYTSINDLIRKNAGARWSQTGKCWYLPLDRDSYDKLKSIITDRATIESGELKKYLEKKKLPAASQATALKITSPLKVLDHRQPTFRRFISPINKHVLPAMEQQLKLKAFSSSTIRTYLNEMMQLLLGIKDIPADELTPELLKRYLVYCYEKLRLKENTLHSRINAMKFYYERVLGREKFFWEIPRPKKQLILPKLLNEKELGRLFNVLGNKKHKAMLFTAYSAGLRVSEIVNLKIKDIDSVRMQILIQKAKGKKDRYVNLSPVLLDILRNYFRSYEPKPKKYLFESEYSGEAYPVRTVQQIFTNAKKKAGINKDVGIHSLRHSFATHLLEKGVDIRYIKDLLGHFDIRTTERYLHVARQKLVNIVSPLDDLFEKEKIAW